ncbi:MAG TPA: cytochrome C oxidase Cbb3, partial [Alcanivorax sp.]|nr:cytochrome C oxidase Cbb3 [Alcanivorax sp.]
IMQGLMWRAVNEDGTLTYNFVQELAERQPFYIVRLLGGVIFLAGMILMAVNVWMTIRGTRSDEGELNLVGAEA